MALEKAVDVRLPAWPPSDAALTVARLSQREVGALRLLSGGSTDGEIANENAVQSLTHRGLYPFI